MNKLKYLTLALLLFILNRNNVNAGYCDKDNIDKLKIDAQKITATYSYNDNYYINDEKINGTFKIEVANMPSDMYAKILNSDIRFDYNNDNPILKEGIKSGRQELIIYYKTCNIELRTINFNFPKYNIFSEREECSNIDSKELDVCDKWYPYELNENKFQYQLKKYNENKPKNEIIEQENEEESLLNSIVFFLRKYYLYIIIAIVLIVVLTGIFTIKKKRYSLE